MIVTVLGSGHAVPTARRACSGYLVEWSGGAVLLDASAGTYMRALMNPVTQSLTADLNDANIDTLEPYVDEMVTRWLGWIDSADPVPESERAELQQRDHRIRTSSYGRDPMNKLAVQVFGEDMVDSMVEIRMGREQMQRALVGDR